MKLVGVRGAEETSRNLPPHLCLTAPSFCDGIFQSLIKGKSLCNRKPRSYNIVEPNFSNAFPTSFFIHFITIHFSLTFLDEQLDIQVRLPRTEYVSLSRTELNALTKLINLLTRETRSGRGGRYEKQMHVT
ncbi:hypothetical protein AMTR_s00217p00014060 [Amborella trichopoda]|uniref:Uncharacterized protein n=1 Tax=Amborella trichopoda TaxID=13333 RepID=W1P1G2_AMBTC|nr:hypothetical protein AMTR_s00217p00014060 [Amborella trichopoda]